MDVSRGDLTGAKRSKLMVESAASRLRVNWATLKEAMRDVRGAAA